MRLFESFFVLVGDTKLLDVGGEPAFWNDYPLKPHTTIVNNRLDNVAPRDLTNYSFVIADGRALPFPDYCFDIAFSNSVIEHLSNYENQRQFSTEIRKAAKCLWVQTPAKWFPVEPHFLGLFVHYFPKGLQRKLIRYFTLWGLLHKPKKTKIDMRVSEIRLLTHSDMKKLFPDCQILRERFLFLTKSYIAIRK